MLSPSFIACPRPAAMAGVAGPREGGNERQASTPSGIATRLGNHSFRATGITAYLKNGGTLEKTAQMATHASTRTTQLYDRRREELSLDEVERIRV
jgi:integrase